MGEVQLLAQSRGNIHLGCIGEIRPAHDGLVAVAGYESSAPSCPAGHTHHLRPFNRYDNASVEKKPCIGTPILLASAIMLSPPERNFPRGGRSSSPPVGRVQHVVANGVLALHGEAAVVDQPSPWPVPPAG